MPRTADRCKETSTTTGTGSLTLAGAVSQYQSFNTAFGTSADNWISYAIVGQTGTEWEVGLGRLTGTTTLTRDTVYYSSNANALVNLSAGTKDVFATYDGPQARSSSRGMSDALNRNWAMP
jgi:hypothetical protein